LDGQRSPIREGSGQSQKKAREEKRSTSLGSSASHADGELGDQRVFRKENLAPSHQDKLKKGLS
jgi:hypothetical protein